MIAPPSISISASYVGASSQTVTDSVIGPIERELTAVKNVLYFESSADASGGASITVTFSPGTVPELAQVAVQNRLKSVETRLPEPCGRGGLSVEAASSGFLMIVSLRSPTARSTRWRWTIISPPALARAEADCRRRPRAVVRLGGAMRVWVDPALLTSYSLSMSEIVQAIQTQNIQVARQARGRADRSGQTGRSACRSASADNSGRLRSLPRSCCAPIPTDRG